MIYLNFIIIIFLSLLIINKIKFIPNFFIIYDIPDKKRKLHKGSVPLLGGVVLFTCSIVSLINILFLSEIKFKIFLILVTLIILFFLLGFLDDKFKLTPLKKTIIIFMILLSILPLEKKLIINILNFKDFDQPILLNQASIFFTVICVYFLYNFLNFIDGMNGLAITLCIFYFLIFLFNECFNIFFLISILLSMMILLIYNIKNKIFLGNSGISILSILISFIIIYSYNNKTFIKSDEILLLFFLPAIDAIRITLERIFNGRSPFDADNNHLHHLLTKIIKKNYVFIIYFLISVIPINLSFFGIKTYYALLISIILYVFFYYYLSKKQKNVF